MQVEIVSSLLTQQVLKSGITPIAFIGTFVFLTITLWSQLYQGLSVYPHVDSFWASLSIILLGLAEYNFSSWVQTTGRFPSKITNGLRVVFVGSLCLSAGLVFFQTSSTSSHPIDVLISAKQAQHNTWAQQANKSRTLADAVGEYKRRYQQPPPPYVFLILCSR